DWLIFRRFEINSADPSGSKNEKKKNCCPRWHGAPEGTARPSGCKGKTGTHEGSERYFSVKAQRKPPDLLIHSTGKNQSASSANRKKFEPGSTFSIWQPPALRVSKTAPAPSLTTMPCPLSGVRALRSKRHCR